MKKIFMGITIALLIVVNSLNAANHKEDFTFKFKDLNGNQIVLKTFLEGIHFSNAKNKVVLLSFWGNQCPPCLMEMPELIDLQEKYKDSFLIEAFQVQTRISDDDLRAFVKEKGINYPVINDSDPEVFKFSDYITAKTSWKGLIPFSILFDRKGNATKIYLGLKSEKEFKQDIEDLINKK
jgi:peroxiredoxin